MTYIVIPVHNRMGFSKRCLESLAVQTVRDFVTIVIDDGSTDGTNEMIRKKFPNTVLIQGDGILWWSAATNLGVKHALGRGAENIITLNDDTIAAEDFIEKMLYWAEKMPNALLGAFAVEMMYSAIMMLNYISSRMKAAVFTSEETKASAIIFGIYSALKAQVICRNSLFTLCGTALSVIYCLS